MNKLELAQQTKRSHQEQSLEQVAAVLCEHIKSNSNYDLPLKELRQELRRINDEDGWDFEVCWDDGDYNDVEKFTSVYGLTLLAEDFDKAWILAQALLAIYLS